MRRIGALFAALAGLLLGAWTHGSLPIYFVSDIASYGWTVPVGTPSVYDASTQTIWFSWEGWQPVSGTPQRVVESSTYNVGTGQWTPNVVIGTRVLANPGDIHGVPSQAPSAAGCHYNFYGSHSSDQQYTYTTTANNPAGWSDTGTLAAATYGPFTFPRPFVVGSTLYLLYATRGTPDNLTGDQAAIALTTATIGAGCALTWSGTFTRLVNVTTASPQHDGFAFPGSAWLSGTKINMLLSYGLTIGMFPLQNIYLFSYDTATDSVANFEGVPFAQPVQKATLDASFKIYTSSNMPCCNANGVIDDAGVTHVVDIDNQSGTPVLFEINNSGSGWSAPHTIYSFDPAQAANLTYAEITKAANGGIAVYFFDNTSGYTSYAVGSGNIWKAIRASNGVWSSNSMVLAATRYGFNNAAKIENGPESARVVFTEISPDVTTIIGTLRGFTYSDSTGFLKRQNFLLKRDIDPATNDNDPMWLEKAA